MAVTQNLLPAQLLLELFFTPLSEASSSIYDIFYNMVGKRYYCARQYNTIPLFTFVVQKVLEKFRVHTSRPYHNPLKKLAILL